MYKIIILLGLTTTCLFGSLQTITSFESDFTQTVVDDQNTSIAYIGHLQAKKPLYAIWSYIKPVEKQIFLNKSTVTIVEPEIEQVIIKNIDSNLDFFSIIKNAKKISDNAYKATYKETEFQIEIKNNFIQAISYRDEFENSVNISFSHQKQNHFIDDTVFEASFPQDYDLIME